MAYATVALLRLHTEYTSSIISDADVTSLIGRADEMTRRAIAIRVYNEELDGDIDGSNTIFTTKKKPIADWNYDKTVDDSDVTVYLVDYDSENNPISASTTVSSVNARDGIITLTSAPNTSNAEVGVFSDYSYYNGNIQTPDWDRVSQVSTYFLAYLIANKLEGHTPLYYTLQDLRIRRGYPGQVWIKAAMKELYSMLGQNSRFKKPQASKFGVSY